MSARLLDIEDLSVSFHTPEGVARAVDGVGFELNRGDSLGIVGESGCGKTTIGRMILRLIEPTGGCIAFDGADLDKYPHEFSGGQRQRIGIACARCVRPELIVADEPVSALDVSMQAQVINLLEDLREEFRLSYVFISHDLSVVEHICSRIAVMYLISIVELAPTESFSRAPRHPYTQALLSAVPLPDPQRKTGQFAMEGDVPSPIDPPAGCTFHPRCRCAFERCRVEKPVLAPATQDHSVACWLNDGRGRF